MDLVNLQVNTFQKRCSSPEPWGFCTKSNRKHGGVSVKVERWDLKSEHQSKNAKEISREQCSTLVEKKRRMRTDESMSMRAG